MIADVRAEEAAPRFSAEECLVIESRELKVAIHLAGVAESQIQNLLSVLVCCRGKHLRFQRCPSHISASSLQLESCPRSGKRERDGCCDEMGSSCEDLIRGGG